jgi:hypothetical protein
MKKESVVEKQRVPKKKSIIEKGILTEQQVIDYITESNSIEQIFRYPTDQEIEEMDCFLDRDTMTIEELQKFVSVYEPTASLRDKYGMNVRVGKYYPPYGGPGIREDLQALLNNQSKWSSHKLHVEYELLHPFSDGNGRSGRALWLWRRLNERHMKNYSPFLLEFYYQTLHEASEVRKEPVYTAQKDWSYDKI